MDSALQNRDATSQQPAHFSPIHQDSSPLGFYQLEVSGLHYAYPLQDAMDDFTGAQNDVNSLSSPLIKPLDYSLLASPFTLSSKNRSESVDSNVTLINTPPKIFRFPDTEVSMFQPAPASSPCIGAFHFSPSSSDSGKSCKSVYYTPLGEAFHDQFDWILSQSDESPVIRSQEPLSQALDVDKDLDFPAFRSLLDRFRAISPSSQPTTPIRLTLPGPLSLSPLTPLSCSPSPIPTRKRKRKFSESSVSNLRKKRCRFDLSFKNKENISPSLASITAATTTSNPRKPSVYSQRTLPKSVEICTNYPLFYRRFPVSSFFQLPNEKSPCTLFHVQHPGGTYNSPRGPLDLYTPRFVRGISLSKVGLCPICVEPVARGGENNKLWLSTKFSAFNYHMQYSHGICAATGRPFSPPLAFRTVTRNKAAKMERSKIQEGKCHKCSKWVAVEGIKDVQVKVKEIYWWKHAALCHRGSTIKGEGDWFEDDSVFKQLSGVY